MTTITLVGKIVRWVRRPADLLVRVTVLDGVDDADKHCYVAVRDRRHALVAWSPALTITCMLERVYDAEPVSLTGNERTMQQRPTSRAKFTGEATGVALVYSLERVVTIESIGVALCVSDMSRALIAPQRREMARARATTGEAARNALTSLTAVDELLRGAASLRSDERARALTIAADALLPSAIIVAHRDGLASRSALLQLPTAQLHTFVVRALSERTIEARRALARCADFALDFTTPMPRHALTGGADETCPLDVALAVARASRSTRFTLVDGVSKHESAHIIKVADHEFAGVRDYTGEHEAARLLRTHPVLVLTCGVGALAGAHASLERRVAALLAHVDITLTHFTYVASTLVATEAAARHGAFECSSVDEVLGGRVASVHGVPSALVFVDAHRIGVDSFVRTVHTLLADDTTTPLVLVGDPLDANGSSRAGDRGAVLRDTVAAARRHFDARIEAALPLEPIGRLGPLDAVAHTQLRRRTEPHLVCDALALVHCDDWRRRAGDVPALVAVASRRRAAEAAVAARWLERTAQLTTGLVEGCWITLEHSGDVVRVAETRRLCAVPPQSGAQLALGDGNSFAVDFLPLDDRLGVIVVERSIIDHRLCCRLGTRTALSLARHCAELRRADVACARTLARLAPEPLFDEADLLLVDERSAIEDVRAALALVRRRLYVHGSAAALVAALKRHGARPRTGLVDALLAAKMFDPRAPMPLIAALPLAVPPPAPYTLYFVGSLNSATLKTARMQQGGNAFTLVSVGALREHTLAWLNNDDNDATPSVDESLVDQLATLGRTELCERVTAYVNALLDDAVSQAPVETKVVEHIVCVAAHGRLDGAALLARGASAWCVDNVARVRAPPPLPDNDDECANDLLQFVHAVRERF